MAMSVRSRSHQLAFRCAWISHECIENIVSMRALTISRSDPEAGR